MSISLKYGAAVLPLDPDLYWSDEFKYSPVAQSVEPSLTGALIVQVDGDATRPGRPITLEPEDEFSAWMIRPDLEVLQEWAAIAGAQFVLTLRGVERDVIFRHQDAPAVDAKAVVHYRDESTTTERDTRVDGDWHLVTLKFTEV